MTLTGDAKKGYQRNYMKAKRSNKAETIDGRSNTHEIKKERSNITPVHNLTGLSNLISDPEKRKKLQAIIESFKTSHNPDYAQDVRLGPCGPTLYEIGKLYE